MYIPNPCHENWSKMTPVEQGRHCAQCNNVVMDMTRLSEQEILTILRSGSVHCGLFYEDQLSVPESAKGRLMQALGRMKKEWLVAAMFAMLQLASPAETQATAVQTEQLIHERKLSPIDSGIAMPGYIQGRVSVKNKENPPVIGRTVYFYTESGKLITEIRTDDHGFFAIAMPDSVKNETVLIVVEKHKSKKGRFVRRWGGDKQLTKEGSWTEMQVSYNRRKKIFRPKAMGCPKFR